MSQIIRHNLLLAFVLLLASCTCKEPAVVDGFIPQPAICCNVDLTLVRLYWTRETASRYTNCILVAAHGTEVDGQWMTQPDGQPLIPVRTLLTQIRDQYPHTRIVALICNPGHIRFDMAGVSYSINDVWVVPDRFLSPGLVLDRRTSGVTASGNIYDFVENGW